MTAVHQEPHPGQGRTFVVLSSDRQLHCKTIRVDDWFDRVCGRACWPSSTAHPAAIIYREHAEFAGLPMDEEIVYGWDASSAGFAVHASEIGPEIPAGDAA